MIKNDANSSKKFNYPVNQELNDDCIMTKNHMFKRIDTDFCSFQEMLEKHAEQINEIKFNYYVNTVEFIVSQIKSFDILIEDSKI